MSAQCKTLLLIDNGAQEKKFAFWRSGMAAYDDVGVSSAEGMAELLFNEDRVKRIKMGGARQGFRRRKKYKTFNSGPVANKIEHETCLSVWTTRMMPMWMGY